MFQWVFLLIFMQLSLGQDTCAVVPFAGGTGFGTLGGFKVFRLRVQIDLSDTLQSVTFENAALSDMNLVGEVVEDMVYWECSGQEFSHITIPAVLAALGVDGCSYTPSSAPGCREWVTRQIPWTEIMEGRMFWFLLTESDGDYTLSTEIQIEFTDSGTGNTITLDEQWEGEVLQSELFTEYGIEIPTMDARVTSYSIGPVDTNGNSVLQLEMDLYLSNETMWDLLQNDVTVPLAISTDEGAVDTTSATISGSGDRTWTVSVPVDVCSLAGAFDLTLTKPVEELAVRYSVSTTLQVDMTAACATTNTIGDLPTAFESSVYNDTGYSEEGSDFYLGDTVYVCSTITPYAGALSAISLDSLSLTQSTATTPITTGLVVDSTSPSGDGFEVCYYFPLPETLGASDAGITTSASATFSLTYEDPTTRRRLAVQSHETEHVFTIKSSGCYWDDGSAAKRGAVKAVPCAFYGSETQRCQNYHWEAIEEKCTFYSSPNLALLQTSVAFIVLLAFIIYSSTQLSQLTKVGKD